mmetsp:Transcript_10799/g.37838  ORF Transcript_10799/g.37838 Transcript_10799/m.37838 type:complete len:572 (+) Transcript_10799:427-2142(+)
MHGSVFASRSPHRCRVELHTTLGASIAGVEVRYPEITPQTVACSRLPKLHAQRCRSLQQPRRDPTPGRVQGPSQVGRRLPEEDTPEEGGDRRHQSHNLVEAADMVLIRDHQKQLGLRNVRPPIDRAVRHEELILRCPDDELVEPDEVPRKADRVDHLVESRHQLRGLCLEQLRVHVRISGSGLAAEAALCAPDEGLVVQGPRHGHDRPHARVHSRGVPSHQATLARAHHREALGPEVCVAGEEGADGVHRPDHRLRHRQLHQAKSVGALGPIETQLSPSQQLILPEVQVLVHDVQDGRYVVHHGSGAARPRNQLCGHFQIETATLQVRERWAVRRTVIAPSGIQRSEVPRTARRGTWVALTHHHHQDVEPGRARDLGLGEPALAGHVQDMALPSDTLGRSIQNQTGLSPRVRRVGLGDIIHQALEAVASRGARAVRRCVRQDRVHQRQQSPGSRIQIHSSMPLCRMCRANTSGDGAPSRASLLIVARPPMRVRALQQRRHGLQTSVPLAINAIDHLMVSAVPRAADADDGPAQQRERCERRYKPNTWHGHGCKLRHSGRIATGQRETKRFI